MRNKLSDKYPEQRETICKKIISILELNEYNEFLLCELDTNSEKKQKILDLKEEINKYFACSTISSFKHNFECKRPYLNIVRGILRKLGYIFENSNILFKLENGTYIKTTKYKIFRNN